jgi:AP-3 complex subunit beta
VDIQHIALISIISIALEHPQPFSPFAAHFLVHHFDPPHLWRLKLEALTLIFPFVNTHTKNLILSELEYFAQGYNKDLVKEAVRAIGRCAQSETRNAARCLRVLLRQVESLDGTLVAESLTVIRHIIQQNPAAHSKTVIRLARALESATNPTARASIIWLVGEFSGIDGGNNVAADTLRILAKNFSSESDQAKQQIVLLAAKIYAHHLNRTQPSQPTTNGDTSDAVSDEETQQHPIALLFSYILLLARYDMSYDLRDRARLYKSLLANPSSSQLATLLLLAPKPTPQAPSPSSGREDIALGSAAMVFGKEESIRGYEPLPDWVSISKAPSPSLREPLTTGTSTPKGALAAVGGLSDPRSGSPAGFGSPKFSHLEDNRGSVPVTASKSNEKVEESLEDFLASDDSEEESEEEESDEDDEDSHGSEEDDSDEEGDSDEEEEEEEEEESEHETENAQLLGGRKG